MNVEDRLRHALQTGDPLSIEEVATIVPTAGTPVVRHEANELRSSSPWAGRVVLGGAAACFAVVCYALVATSASSNGVETARAGPAATTSSVDPMAMLQADLARGWVNSGMGPLLPGVERPAGMWLRFYEDDLIDPLHFDEEGKAPTYDAPNGSLIGYTYEYLGFVPLSMVEDPSFDAVESLREVWGCVPEVDRDCTAKPPSARD